MVCRALHRGGNSLLEKILFSIIRDMHSSLAASNHYLGSTLLKISLYSKIFLPSSRTSGTSTSISSPSFVFYKNTLVISPSLPAFIFVGLRDSLPLLVTADTLESG